MPGGRTGLSDAPMPTLALHVEPEPLEPATAHALDAWWLEAVAGRPRGVLRVYRLAGDVVSLGRWHRCPSGAPGIAVHRRRSGGRVAASGDGFVHVTLMLPHRAALVGDDPAALAPAQILNRCVRGLVGGLEALGVPAHYPGRDLVTAGRRPLAVLGLDEDGRGVTVVDAIVSVGRDQSALPPLMDRVDPAGDVPVTMILSDDATSVSRERGTVPGVAEIAGAVTGALEARMGVSCVEASDDGPGGLAPDDAWLSSRAARPSLPRRVHVPAMLGTVEVDLALAADGAIAEAQLCGDVLASSAAVDALERALRGTPPALHVLEAVVERAFAPPAFLLGVHPVRRLAEALAAACR